MPKVSIKELYNFFKLHRGVTTDTRKISKGDLFFALKGPNFDGNKFAEKAIEDGAAFAVVDAPTLAVNDKCLVVDDVLTELQNLAGFYRNTLSIPVIAITGSNGKTTTKELVHTVLSSKFKTSTTKGNLNNHIGIPLTILRIPPDAEMAVIEMGANHLHEIEGYCQYANPTHGMITNCGKAHLEGFGSVEGIRKGKGELFDHLAKTGGPAFVCSDFGYFQQMVQSRQMHSIDWYGTGENADVMGKVKQAEPFLEVEISAGFEEPFAIQTQLVGDYNLYNVLAAITIGRHFGVPASRMKEAIENYLPDNSRSQLVQKDGLTVISDAYNANPSSMAAAIQNFAALKSEKKVLMLGSMAELGIESVQEHQNVISLIDRFTWEKVILVGAEFEKVNTVHPVFPTALDARKWWEANKIEGANILLKGSRSTGMEKVLDF